MSKTVRNLTGEILGTFLMCFFGIGAVANSTFGISGAFGGPFQVGMVWGITIAIAIYCTRNLSDAHFNPAVSFAMLVAGKMNVKDFVIYVIGQFIGAIIAGLILYVLFADAVAASMAAEGINQSVRGTASSIWCEIYPNNSVFNVSAGVATLAEGLGVFLLVTVIMTVTDRANTGYPGKNIFPLFIGLTVTMIICVVGPLTDAGLNPARDLGPRIVAIICGWGAVAIEPMDIVVYTVGPLIGGGLAALCYKYFFGPQHEAVFSVAAQQKVRGAEAVEAALVEYEESVDERNAA